MDDEQNALPPDHDPLLNAGSTAVTEAELDGVLEKAASQLSEIAKNVGEGQPRPAVLESAEDQLTDSEVPDVDQQLDHIDSLLRTASHELGVNPTTPSGGAADTHSPSTSRPEPVPTALPDFMAEFTSPGPSSETTPARPAPRPLTDPPPKPPKAAAPAASAAKPAPASPGTSPILPSAPSGVGPLSRVAEAGIRGLEHFDQWTGFLGPTARCLVGWMAILMLIGALLVFIMG